MECGEISNHAAHLAAAAIIGPKAMALKAAAGLASARLIYCPDGRPTELRFEKLPKPFCPPRLPAPELPAAIYGMGPLATTLSRGSGFVRVDMSELQGGTCRGEFTNYALGRTSNFTPSTFNHELGASWK